MPSKYQCLLQCSAFFLQLITKLKNTLSFFNASLTAQLLRLQTLTTDNNWFINLLQSDCYFSIHSVLQKLEKKETIQRDPIHVVFNTMNTL